MDPRLADPDVVLYHGDVLAVLRELPAESVDCVVTSPPYWGLRDYGTGEWEGGNAGCDHRKGGVATWGPGSTGSSTLQSRPNNDSHEREGWKGDTCGKCGATRIDQQLGLESTPEQYVERMVEVFQEVRRVLAAHGTVWLNLGDSYAGSWGNQGRKAERGTQRPINGPMLQRLHAPDCDMDEDCSCVYPDQGSHTGSWVKNHPNLKPKDLVGIPWRVAFALQADGWYLRSDIIWAKPNPMPESVTDRPTKAHEYVFLLSKQPRYFFDQEAVREEIRWTRFNNPDWNSQRAETNARKHPANRNAQSGGFAGWQPERARPQNETLDGSDGEAPRGPDGRRATRVVAGEFSEQHRDGERWPNGGRNIRSVWEIATQPYPEAHFATFPEELARRCIAAGCPEQVCRVCGKARERVVERQSYDNGDGSPGERGSGDARALSRDETGRRDGFTKPPRNAARNVLPLGFTDCGHADYRHGIVLDPFMGSGTVPFVARKLGRHAVGIDLNESYLQLAARRLQQQSLFADAP